MELIPKEFETVNLGYYEMGTNKCTPYYPDFELYLQNSIEINIPQKIIFNDANIPPVIPVCGAYVVTDRRALKYDLLSAKMLHIRKINEDTWYSGEISDPNLKNEHLVLSPDHTDRQKEIEDAQKYHDSELDEGQSSGSAINVNLLEYVNIPLTSGRYEIYMSFYGLESNHKEVEIIFN